MPGALYTVQRLAVINDKTERSVALIPEFNKKLTTGEERATAIPPSSCVQPSTTIF